MPRTLTEDEFNAVKQKVLDSLPSGLSEADFTRAVAPRMAAAIGEAENLPASISGSSVGRFLSGAWQNLDPIAAVSSLYGAVRHPVETAENLIGQQAEQFRQAGASASSGQPYSALEAIGHAAAGALPIIGPAAARAGQAIGSGDVAGGLGQATGLLAPTLAVPALTRTKALSVPAPASRLSEAEQAAVRFGQAEGIPIDAATASGNRFMRGVQHLSQSSPLGSLVAERAEQARSHALTQTGQRLAEAVTPEAATVEQAGQGVRSSLEGLIGNLHSAANDAYGRLRALEQNPDNAGIVPAAGSDLRQYPAKLEQMGKTLGTVPTGREIDELRRIKAELDAVPFKPGKLIQDNPGIDSSQHYDYRSPGAPVYDDILQMAPGTSKMTRGQVLKSINTALETGAFTNAAKGALEVARARLAGSGGVSKPILPPGAGALTEYMLMPVDLTEAKAALQPVYDSMKRQMPLTQQNASPALKALENLISGPDHAPVSQVDADLSALKGLARGAALPTLRDVSQGLAARAVGQLDAAVKSAVAKAGPDAASALEEGRAATAAKYATAGVLDTLRQEPVQAFRQLTAPKDTQIAYLRQVREYAPGEISKIGRAYLEDLLSTATAEGRFDRAAKIAADWQRLGPETKTILFGSDLVSKLDHFFLLAKRLAESPNPSKTALTLHSGASLAAVFTNPMTGIPYTLGSGALAKLLNSSKGVDLLTRGFTIPSMARAASAPTLSQLLTLVGQEAAPLGRAAEGDQAPATSAR